MPYHFLYNVDYGTAELTAVSNHTVKNKIIFVLCNAVYPVCKCHLAWDNLASTPATKPLQLVLSYQ